MKLHFYILLLATIFFADQISAQQYAEYGKVVAGQKDCSRAFDSLRLTNPVSVCLDSAGNIYVSDSNRIQMWAPGAKYGITVAGQKNGASGSDSLHLWNPAGICVSATGDLYIVDQTNNRVQKWAKGLKYGVTVAGDPHGSYGTDSTHLYGPGWVCVDKKNNIYVSDNGNNRVQKWVAGGKYGITVAGQKSGKGGSDSAHLSGPEGIFVDSLEDVYVAEASNGRVQKWAKGANYGITVAGNKKGLSGGGSNFLNFPVGIWVDRYNNVYVADADNKRIVKWAPHATNGVTVIGNPLAGSCDSAGVNFPWGMYMDKSGSIYVAELLANRVSKWFFFGLGVKDIPTMAESMRIYPNPSNGLFSVDFSATTGSDKGNIQVINYLGQIVCEQLVNNTNGKIQGAFNQPGLPTGIYLVKVSMGNQNITQRLVIAH